MNAEDLRNLQTPLKSDYTDNPQNAVAELSATGTIDLEHVACHVQTHGSCPGKSLPDCIPKPGGDGSLACSGDMLLQSLVACSGVTFAAVATAMELKIEAAQVTAIGAMDFRGTLGVDRTVPVGLTSIELRFKVASPEPEEKIDKLIQLTERLLRRSADPAAKCQCVEPALQRNVKTRIAIVNSRHVSTDTNRDCPECHPGPVCTFPTTAFTHIGPAEAATNQLPQSIGDPLAAVIGFAKHDCPLHSRAGTLELVALV